jgi:small subunit ribosomal protein S17
MSMSDDETKKDETTEDTSPQDEDATSAGPVVESDSSSSQAAGEEPDSTPPADEASAADEEETPPEAPAESDDAPAAEQEEAPAAEAGGEDIPADEEEQAAEGSAEAAPKAAEPDPGDELPWKERRRLERSRRPHDPKPAQTSEERAAARRQARQAKATERRKERAGAKAKKGPAGTGTPVAERDANAAKVRQGIVVSNKGDKSITVRIDIARRHPTYEKIVRRSRTLHAHDERNEAGEGDVVRVIETRPLSKTKRWRLVDVVEKAR